MVCSIHNDSTINDSIPVFAGSKICAVTVIGCVGITLLVVGILMRLHVIQPIPAAMYALPSIGGGILLIDVLFLVALCIQYYKYDKDYQSMIGSPVDAVHAERRVSLVPTTHPSTQDIRTVEWPNIENTQSSNRISAMNLFINDRQQDKAKAEVDAETFFKFNLSNRVLLQREDALKHIFSFLDLEEICMIASTCRTFSVCIAKIHFFNAEQVRQGIEFYGNLARQLNKQILTLTKGCHSLTGNNDILSQNLRFTFPIDLWMAEINSASSVRLSCHSVVFLSACREDLVVALA